MALILSGVYGDILAETAVGNISGLILIFAVVVYSAVGVATMPSFLQRGLESHMEL